MDMSTILSLAQLGFVGVGIFGLWNGFTLYQTLLNATPPDDEAAQEEFKRRHSSIRFFLLVCLVVTLLSAAMDFTKLFITSTSKSDLTIKLSNYHEMDSKLKPVVIRGGETLKFDDFGGSQLLVNNKDFISVEIGDFFEAYKDLKEQFKQVQVQLGSINIDNKSAELGHDDPN